MRKRGVRGKWGVEEGREEGMDRGDLPAQFTSDEGDGRDLYACQRSEAAFARLLS